MNTKPVTLARFQTIRFTFFSCLCAGVLCARANEYQEARVFITAPGAPPAGAPASAATEAVRPMLLADRGFQTFEPLDQPDEHVPTIIIDEGKTFQTIIGFGAAFTDAASTTFGKLPKESQEQFLRACFDPTEGNGYTLCRTTIHSCDYSGEMYTYDDTPGDKDLKDFSIAHDLKDRVPFIKRAQAAAGGNLRLFASPWSPPAWMKTNNDMLHGGKLKPEYNQTWADYFVKYLQAYAREGIPIWGLTVQNEALATQVWESCIYTADEEKDFVKHFLGPALEHAGLSQVKLMIWDHNRGLIYQRAQPAYDDKDASKYIWGTAFHWYTGDHWDNVRIVHDAFPDKHLLYTEGGIGGTWPAALRLSRNVIYDLNNWTEGWVVWNLMCDQEGGPRHAGGIPGASSGTIVNADTTTGKLSFNPPHYVFGQFSRFIRPGAKRIPCTSSSDEFIATAALNPDGSIAVVVNNLTDKETFFRVWRRGQALRYTSPPNATMSFLFQPSAAPK
ncbi:MAG TPA: glycoside hydrolase family 30 protein [Candidatus Acidoferrum sp.]|nr:glycoside hydrolase family 30 protein [Candidatus Acidoferrum sp.]